MDRTTGTLGRIRKLLARAERAGTPAEAQACTDKAVELMARHGIDMALLAAAQPGVDEIGATRVEVADPYSAGKARLLGWTASALRCRAVLHELRGPRHLGRGRIGAVTVFGFATDRERVEVLFTSLLLQAQAQLVVQRPPHPDESVAAYRRSWLHGFAVQVHRRLVEAERRAEERAGNGSASGSGVPGGAGTLRLGGHKADTTGHLKKGRSGAAGQGRGRGCQARREGRSARTRRQAGMPPTLGPMTPHGCRDRHPA